jgi:hypothetical protein
MFLALLLPWPASAQQAGSPAPVTERDVVVAALQRPALAEIIQGEVAIEECRGGAARAYPNPQLSYMREQTFRCQP